MRVLAEKRALITGAASGIGRAIALALAAERTHVYLLDINAAGAEEVAVLARQQGVEAIAARCDVTKPDQITASIGHMLQQWPAIDILVNNVGVAYYGPTDNMTAEQWKWLLEINLLAPLQFTRELLPTLLERPEGHILNVCSIAGLVAGGRFAAYHTSKFGLVGFTEALRAEYVRRGLGLTALCPGPVRTNLFRAAISGRANKAVPEPPAWVCATPEQVARKAIQGIKKNRAVVLVTPMAHGLALLKRVSPGLLDWINCLGRRKKHLPQVAAPSVQRVTAAAPRLKIWVESQDERPATQVSYEHKLGAERLYFASHGQYCEAWLMRPADTREQAPLVLMAHGFAAEKSFGLGPYVEHFVRRGLAVMLFDYRRFGGSAGMHRNLVIRARQREDWQAALNFARQLPGIDATRIALWGISLDGGHVLDCASRNPDIAAVIAQTPVLDAPGSPRGDQLSQGLQVLGHGLYELLRAALRRIPYRLGMEAPTPTFSMTNKPNPAAGYGRSASRAKNLSNAFPARILLKSLFHRPLKHDAQVKCPTLFVLADDDQLVPAQVVRTAAARMPDATVVSLPGDHFSLYFDETFEQAVGHQADFLENCVVNARTLPLAAPKLSTPVAPFSQRTANNRAA